jgi:hypothetical protein
MYVAIALYTIACVRVSPVSGKPVAKRASKGHYKRYPVARQMPAKI